MVFPKGFPLTCPMGLMKPVVDIFILATTLFLCVTFEKRSHFRLLERLRYPIMRYHIPRTCLAYIFLLIPTRSSFAFASKQHYSPSTTLSLERDVSGRKVRGSFPDENSSSTSSSLRASKESIIEISGGSLAVSRKKKHSVASKGRKIL